MNVRVVCEENVSSVFVCRQTLSVAIGIERLSINISHVLVFYHKIVEPFIETYAYVKQVI